MLFLNRQQISAEALMMKFASRMDFENVKKRPSFEINKSRRKVDHLNGGKIKTPKASGMRSHFMAYDKTSNLKVEIRYAESNNSRVVGDRVIDEFEPRYVNTNGATFAFQNNLDLAVYIFLNPNNVLSPLKTGNGKGKYEYIDTKKRSKDKVAAIDALTDALSHAKNLSEERLLILAKGLGIKGTDKKEVEDVRADVMEFASKFPKVYNEKSGTELTYVEGRITNLIDKGIVKLQNVGTMRRWTWTSGEREGEHILDIMNVTQDARQALKNYFFSDLNKHMNILNNITNDISAVEKAKRDLAAYEAAMNPAPIVDPTERTIGDALPDYLKNADQIVLNQDVPEKIPMYTKEDAIRELSDEYGNPPHHKTVEKWLKEKNGE